MAELLFWPALLAYSEAAVAYLNDVRHPGLAGRLATWGVRVGWLVQTALLAVQATRANGFPWSTWGGSLNLFVWLVVGAYLIWGCQPRYRLLGLAVLPLAVVLFILARVGGGTGVGSRSHYSNLFLVLHVGLVLAAFAGFTLAVGPFGALPLAGTTTEAPRELDPPPARTRALTAGRGGGPHDRVRAPRTHTRDRSRHRTAARPRWRLRRADGGHHRHVDGVRVVACTTTPRRLARSPGGRISYSPASCSSPSFVLPSP